MAKTKKEEKVVEPVDTTREQLEARQAYLLGLLETLDREGFRDRGNIEVALSVVNRELNA
jgi:hypothetical protein